ncbi:hypothetical protein SAMN06295967_11439 [Belliella buryatensis]|uniref:Acetyltransferase (GNAT) domain-containing protein n=1 Tax=Belliella buryatensis TaxID=1500549 RepID=A0A239FZ79_9BACT|nr:hypothetical protein [Belliella buryatensis]SNS62211.1 hypothetical protein SAMN06295967_11439 [Belliella buryatensis]
MTKFERNSLDHYNFTLSEARDEQHDYFLQVFKPHDAKLFLLGRIWKKDQEKAFLFISIDANEFACSLPNLPFGGLWTHESIPSDVLEGFISFLLDSLLQLQVKRFAVTQAPAAYGNQADLFSYLLFKSGFDLENVLNHQILCGKKRIKKWLTQNFTKLYKKAKENKFNVTTGNIQSFTFLEEITTWKDDRGHKQPLDENRLIQQVSTYPERYFVITVLHDGKAVAHALAVKLTSESLYYFYSAINPKNQLRLTGQLMMAYLLKLSVEQKVSLLDLGSSEANDEPNHKLIYFKNKYADTYWNKSTWIKSL